MHNFSVILPAGIPQLGKRILDAFQTLVLQRGTETLSCHHIRHSLLSFSLTYVFRPMIIEVVNVQKYLQTLNNNSISKVWSFYMGEWKCPCNQVHPENVPRTFKNPAKVVVKCIQLEILNKDQSILEAGSGCLRNSFFLQEEGFDVSVVELKETVDRFKEEYDLFEKKGGKVYVHNFPLKEFDVVISTFTIETICPPKKRVEFLRNIYGCLKKDGLLISSMRGVKDVLTAGEKGKGLKCPLPGNGYLTPLKTFIRPFHVRQITVFLEQNGFRVERIFQKSEKIEPRIIELLARKIGDR